MSDMDKRTFKICEAVALGLDKYYMETWKPIPIGPDDRALADKAIPTLPYGWMREKHPWDACKR